MSRMSKESKRRLNLDWIVKAKHHKSSSIPADRDSMSATHLKHELRTKLEILSNIEPGWKKRKDIINEMRILYEASKLSMPWRRYDLLRQMIIECIHKSKTLGINSNGSTNNSLGGIVQTAASFSDTVKELTAHKKYSKGTSDIGNLMANFDASLSVNEKDKEAMKKEISRVESQIKKKRAFIEEFDSNLNNLETTFEEVRFICNPISRYNHLKKISKQMCFPKSP
ncbi:hypothetical protein ACOME3_006975 [Neoechinorhynchus agilis]